LLAKLRAMINIPLVLHGGSDLSDEVVRKAVSLGIRKFNVWTDLAVAQVKSIRQTLEPNSELIDPRLVFTPSMQAITAVTIKNSA
jgi:fructose/tagatose bisphosphate aldolase